MSEQEVEVAGPDARPNRTGRLLWVVLGVAAAVLALDQFSKWMIVTKVKPVGTVDVIGHYLRFVYVENSGAAFSIGINFTWVFTLIAVVVAVVIIRTSRKLGSIAWAIALGALLGGALGNLCDRLFRTSEFGRGYVVDFIALPHFAVFNVADMAITGSAAFMVLLALRGVSFSGATAKG